MDVDQFYKHHRGGVGCVILVSSFRDSEERQAIFGSIELANSYMDRLGEDWANVATPFIVDDPDWGNEKTN